MNLKVFILIIFVNLSLCLPGPGSRTIIASPDEGKRAATPTAQVRTILEEVMAIQTDPQLQGPPFRNRQRTAIKRIIGQNFCFDIMARRSLGTYWGKLNEAERADFKGIFQELFQESYTKLVLDFLKQEKILYIAEKIESNKALVKTKISRANEDIPVDYTLLIVQGRWLVEDVSIDGVSIVGNYQRSFSQVIKRESYASLIKKMRLQRKAIEEPSP